MLCKRELDQRVSLRRERMRAQIVAEKQRVAAIGTACSAYMHVRRTLARGRLIILFLPVARVCAHRERRHVVDREVAAAQISRLQERRLKVRGELADGDLHVNDVLGRQSWHRRGPNVVYPQRHVAHRVSQSSGYCLVFLCPLRTIRNDDDLPVGWRLHLTHPLHFSGSAWADPSDCGYAQRAVDSTTSALASRK